MIFEMEQQALIFLHIPKTAGTTLNRIIEWQYNPLSIFTMDPYRIRATPERLGKLSDERRRGLRMVRGHFYYGLHELLPQGATYMTMLREPVARFFSSYYFLQRRPLHPMHRKVTSERIGVEDFIRLTPHRQNLQCSLIAGIKSTGKCEESTLELAKQHLAESFSVVGICERFEESLILMAQTYNWDVPFYENRKVSKTRPIVQPGAVEMIKEHNQLDLELYRFGKEIFEASLAKKKREVEEGLARLRTLSKPTPIESFCKSTVSAGRFLMTKIASAV
ncbi:MAG: sulfotransferase family 2 domain-containing protein [Chthoniobacterales bacterium]